MPSRPTTPPDPPLADDVVTLRPWARGDVRALAESIDDEIARWLDSVPQPYGEPEARAYVAYSERGWRGRGAETPFAVVDTETGALLGSCGVHWLDPEQALAEVGYWVRGDARGRGVATRATRLVAGWVLGTLRYERLQLRADVRNEASCRVAEHAGFTREGVLRSYRWSRRQGRRIDIVMYSLLRSDL